MNFKVVYYVKSNGDVPVLNFLDRLDIKMTVVVMRNIILLEKNGHQLKMPYSKSLRKGLFELRTQSNGNITRIIYFFYHHKTIILTNGFVKKTNKTPPKEIRIAKAFQKEFIKRMRNENENSKL